MIGTGRNYVQGSWQGSSAENGENKRWQDKVRPEWDIGGNWESGTYKAVNIARGSQD